MALLTELNDITALLNVNEQTDNTKQDANEEQKDLERLYGLTIEKDNEIGKAEIPKESNQTFDYQKVSINTSLNIKPDLNTFSNDKSRSQVKTPQYYHYKDNLIKDPDWNQFLLNLEEYETNLYLPVPGTMFLIDDIKWVLLGYNTEIPAYIKYKSKSGDIVYISSRDEKTLLLPTNRVCTPDDVKFEDPIDFTKVTTTGFEELPLYQDKNGKPKVPNPNPEDIIFSLSGDPSASLGLAASLVMTAVKPDVLKTKQCFGCVEYGTDNKYSVPKIITDTMNIKYYFSGYTATLQATSPITKNDTDIFIESCTDNFIYAMDDTIQNINIWQVSSVREYLNMIYSMLMKAKCPEFSKVLMPCVTRMMETLEKVGTVNSIDKFWLLNFENINTQLDLEFQIQNDEQPVINYTSNYINMFSQGELKTDLRIQKFYRKNDETVTKNIRLAKNTKEYLSFFSGYIYNFYSCYKFDGLDVFVAPAPACLIG